MKLSPALLLASSLTACAGGAQEDFELPDTIVDGAADSWGHPTPFGQLHAGVWQRGELIPSSKIQFASWQFSVSGDANVTVETRQAPTDDPDLHAAATYLYKQRETGTWKRIARSEGTEFGALAKALDEGTYRVIVKGIHADDAGDFLLQRTCEGPGCAAAQCIFGDGFAELADVHHGSLTNFGSKTLTIASPRNALQEAQIIAAVHESAHDDVTTIEEAFAAVDGEEILRYRFWDSLSGRPYVAFEYGSGDNSFGAIFPDDLATPAAAIHDGDIANCTAAPRACVFGEHMGEAAFMPDMKETGTRELTIADAIDAETEALIVEATEAATLQEAFDNVDEETIWVSTYEHADGRTFVEVQWYGGDNPVGTFFRAGSDTPVAHNGDGDLFDCTEF